MQDQWYENRWVIETVLDPKAKLYKIRSFDDTQEERVESRLNLRAAKPVEDSSIHPTLRVAANSPRRLRSRVIQGESRVCPE